MSEDLTDGLCRILGMLDVCCPKCRTPMVYEASPANGAIILWCHNDCAEVEVAFKGVIRKKGEGV